MNKVVEKWDEILQIVKTEHDLSDVSFNTWLKPLTVYEVVDNVVTTYRAFRAGRSQLYK